ncbi:hypothetical protein MUB24_11350 [Lederbergia sp. NSJ-179]|uniref:hypothetical protein n=1 Tax=Lederbergia sp. NSJ-179 TaxID=2931402 RepID=UPI001FD2C389|nr:hypothetical protein [Lederbergia sp. NSJ-179]MCJ7841480.1 hypothetical protein [Lederbergia sp. NSJ-179]
MSFIWKSLFFNVKTKRSFCDGKKFSMVFLSMISALIALLIGAKNPTGPNTVSFDEPAILWLSIGILVVLFLPPFILSLFNHLAVRIISAIYQFFIVLSFLGLVLAGFMMPTYWVMVIGAIGAIVSICSIFVTIFAGLKKRNLVTN